MIEQTKWRFPQCLSSAHACCEAVQCDGPSCDQQLIMVVHMMGADCGVAVTCVPSRANKGFYNHMQHPLLTFRPHTPANLLGSFAATKAVQPHPPSSTRRQVSFYVLISEVFRSAARAPCMHPANKPCQSDVKTIVDDARLPVHHFHFIPTCISLRPSSLAKQISVATNGAPGRPVLSRNPDLTHPGATTVLLTADIHTAPSHARSTPAR